MLLARRPDEAAAPADRVGRERSDAHRDDGPLRGREWPDRRQELVGAAAIHHPKHGVTALGQAESPLASVLWFLVALDEPPPDEPVDEPAGGRWRAADRLGELADSQRVPIGKDVQGSQLRETEPELPELPGEPDHELAPEGAAHRD